MGIVQKRPMTMAEIQQAVRECWYDTVTADAFRRACGIECAAPKPHRRRRRAGDVDAARLMRNRYGCCDRHGKL